MAKYEREKGEPMAAGGKENKCTQWVYEIPQGTPTNGKHNNGAAATQKVSQKCFHVC